MRRCLGCRKGIERRYVTCQVCWLALPLAMREKFMREGGAARTVVAIDIVHWFRDNPPEGT